MRLNKGIILSTIKNRFVLISSIGLLIFILFGIFTTHSLVQLNTEVEKLLNVSELRTKAIFKAHESISNMESELIKLIIADDKDNIRTTSIASIRATSALDESLQQLELQLPDSSYVAALSKNLILIKPHRMNIIGLARLNQDFKALNIVNEISPITDIIGKDLDRIILNDRKNLNRLLKEYKHSEIKILILFVSIITLSTLLLVFVNISLQKAKMALRKLNLMLENKVKSRTEELETSYSEIECALEKLQQTQGKLIESEKMACLGGLVSGIAHELNTPIGVCITSSSYLYDSTTLFHQQYIEGTLDETDCETFIYTNKDSMKLIISNLNKCSDLIQYFKKISVQQSSEKPEKLMIKKCVDESVMNTRIHFKNIQSKSIVNCPNALQVQHVSSVLHEIVMNLVMNSLQHGNDKATNEVIEINIDISKSRNMVKLIYWDSGKGIDISNIDKIFEPFYTTKRSEGQNGLGLTIVYNLSMHSLNGYIICRHNQDNQTVFELEFPDNL
jgi:C4-dicarboxylate-specific signal transduction histidine kinase